MRDYQTLVGQISAGLTSGSITPLDMLTGEITIPSLNSVTGKITVPSTIDRTAIHYDTTEAWNSMRDYIAEEGHIYIYSDHTTKIDEATGKVLKYPAIKIGDGTSYLIDMPFIESGMEQEFIDHINDKKIHVSDVDRTSWSSKVRIAINEEDAENVIFSF